MFFFFKQKANGFSISVSNPFHFQYIHRPLCIVLKKCIALKESSLINVLSVTFYDEICSFKITDLLFSLISCADFVLGSPGAVLPSDN